MSPDRDSRLAPSDQPDDEFEDDDAPRSILSAAWFRVVLVFLGVVIVGAVAMPYVLEVVNPPPPYVAGAMNPRAVLPKAPVAPSPVTSPAPSEGAGTRPSMSAQPMTPAPGPVASAPSSASAPPPMTTGPARPRDVTAPATMTTPAPTEAAKPSMPAKDNAATSKAPQAAPRMERPAAASIAKDTSPGERVAAMRSAPAHATAAEGGEYFVQVGAFRDQETARRVAARLRAQNYPVTESVKRVSGGTVAEAPRPAPRAPGTAASGPDRYDVIVTGGPTADINTKLAAKGLAAEPAGEGVRIRPSLPLRDAVALSKDLSNEGFKVQVRRGGTSIATAAAPVRTPTVSDGDGGGEILYRVRVGGYPDRATAQSALRVLQGKGYQPFIAKGRE